METNKEKSQNKRNRLPSEPPGDPTDSIAKKPRDTTEMAMEEPRDTTEVVSVEPRDTTESVLVEPRDTTEVVLVEPRDDTGQVLTTETKQTEDSDETRDEPAPVIGDPSETVGSSATSGQSSSYSSTPSPMCGEAVNDDSNIGNETDSDLDYDDLDDIACNSDVEDVMDDEGADEGGEDDISVASTVTTMSTGSVGSNTPSLVGENLETISLGEAAQRKTWVSIPPSTTDSPPLRMSLFPNVPPTLNFMLHNEVSSLQLPDELRKCLRWKLSTITPAIVKRCASNTGYRLMRRTCTDWAATWGKHMKSPQFRELRVGQKINHFPGTFNIGRKDRLWKNYHRLMIKYGKNEFGFLPRTFCLPADSKLLRKVWERRGGRGRWIVKPPALARGTGIKVVNKWSQIPKTRPLIVQRYVARPYLINGTKFDLRLYVLVTSVNPLRIYLYDDGLVRFASNKYTNDTKSVGDVYTHLTNYSINKNSASYLPNEDSDVRQGHKWTLKSLWRHFDEEGIDHSEIWEKIKDLINKTIISAENPMATLFQQNVGSRYSCYELFGFDILLDSRLKPWLIEVNISPSLHSSSPLDLDVKSPLATEVFNMARYHIPNRLRQSTQREMAAKMGLGDNANLCLDKRIYVKEVSKAERIKQDSWLSVAAASDTTVPPQGILDHLTPDDVRHLVVSEDELATSRRFQRIFPTSATDPYLRFMEKPRYYNLLLSAWEIKYSGINREKGRAILENLCSQKVHLKVPANVYVRKTPSGQQAIDISGLTAPSDSSSRSVTPPGVASESQGTGDTPAVEETATENTKNHDHDVDKAEEKDVDYVDLKSEVAKQPGPSPGRGASNLGTRSSKVGKIGVVAKPMNVKTVPPASNRFSRPAPSSSCCCVRLHSDECVRDKDSGSESDCRMDWGSVTPSPGCTPEHPGATPPHPGGTSSSGGGVLKPQVYLLNEKNLEKEKSSDQDIMNNKQAVDNATCGVFDNLNNFITRAVDNRQGNIGQ